MLEHNRLLIEAMYVSWEAGDLPSMMSFFADDVVFAVHPVEATTTIVGHGQGKELFASRLALFLHDYEVVDYSTPYISADGDSVDCRISYHYRHRKNGMEIDGSMRHVWKIADGKIVRFDVIHDALRMGAFFELAARTDDA